MRNVPLFSANLTLCKSGIYHQRWQCQGTSGVKLIANVRRLNRTSTSHGKVGGCQLTPGCDTSGPFMCKGRQHEQL